MISFTYINMFVNAIKNGEVYNFTDDSVNKMYWEGEMRAKLPSLGILILKLRKMCQDLKGGN